jgi:PAS domain S-box-containing protein
MHLSRSGSPDRVAYLWAIVITGLAAIARAALGPLLGARYPFGTFYAAVALIGWFWGGKPAVLSAILGYLLGASLYLLPRDPRLHVAVDPIELIAYITICGTLIALVYRVYERQRRLDAALTAHASTRAALASSDVELAFSERRYRSVSEAFEFGMWSADAAGRLSFVSPQFLDFLGATLDAASRRWWSAIAASPNEIAGAQLRWKRCQITGERWDWEYSLRGTQGRVRRIWTQAIALRSVAGVVTSWAGLNLDVTDRYEAARARDQAWQRLELVTNVMSVGVAQCNAQRQFVWMNPAYARGIGLSPADIERTCGQRVGAVLGPALYSRLEPAFDEVLEGERVEFEGELGTGMEPQRWIHTSLIPLWSGDKMPSGWVTVTSDLSQRRALEEQLRESNRRKDDFLATLAHELRNPLAPIRYATHLMKPGNPVEVASDARRIIDRQLAHMARLLDDLLDVSRITRGTLVIQRDLMDLRVALQHAVDAARPLAEAVEQHLQLELPDHPLPVNGDETRLMQVFGNLINNAIKFTNPGGTVSVSAALDEQGLLARIRDTGRGISPEFLPRVFDMFAQAEPNARSHWPNKSRNSMRGESRPRATGCIGAASFG